MLKGASLEVRESIAGFLIIPIGKLAAEGFSFYKASHLGVCRYIMLMIESQSCMKFRMTEVLNSCAFNGVHSRGKIGARWDLA